jgi:GNAT superfamily N-acetyltransferase
MANFKLRSLCPADLDRVSDIESKIAGSPRRPFFEKRLALATAQPESFITCGAEEGGTLLGFAFARIQGGDFGKLGTLAVLDNLNVDPDAQGKGVGKAVMSGIEHRMKTKHISTLKTEAVWTNRAMTGFFSAAGFRLAASQIIERDTSLLREEVAEVTTIRMDSRWQVHSSAGGNDYDRLNRDRVLVRSFKQEDLAAVVRIDGKLTGQDRSAYYAAKSREVLDESGIRVSVVSEDDGIVTGFIMARVDFGEFGKLDAQAVIDTIGVHPAYKGSGIGHALLSQLLLNLSTLKVESVRTQVSWENSDLHRFLHRCGFSPSQRLILTKAVS